MTINDYLQNPYGKGSSYSNIAKQKEDLESQQRAKMILEAGLKMLQESEQEKKWMA